MTSPNVLIITSSPTINGNGDIIAAIDRMYYPIALTPGYKRGPQKKLGVILTCAGSSAEWLELLIDRTLTASLRASVSDLNIAVFDHCPPLYGRSLDAGYRKQVVDLARWCV
ncbi:NADPH-dependent FMN reductase [Bifidobacterium ramosum]|uniref:NADPH-dependent FMN reductase n=1 Tax=Bifidobacterium ramosum TaxID=1798158 RepID=A0A6L4WXY7_9BIFI|nr:hypothetical protein [Bifidobacterium ramosum]KAB8286826.1 NADPH-dependent FMN reductase [Bifidobacterium ramosum]NEG72664.1 hypothetical protein [Bifidobacterium ramosum]